MFLLGVIAVLKEEVFVDKSMINEMVEGEDKKDESRIKETV